MEEWQDAASQQVKLLTNRLNELLSKGLELLRSELGVDLGLKPELIPPWMILLAACTGLVLMVALWASVCRALFKKRPAVSSVDDGIEVKRSVSKPVKAEEPKKKKKKAEKKAQPNGRAVAEPQEEAIVSEEILPHHQPPPAEVKAEKVTEVISKCATILYCTWETKVSNKEKREQRKKDKSSSDGSASPGGGDTPVSAPPEQPKASAAPANQKKKKGGSAKHSASFYMMLKAQQSTNPLNSGRQTVIWHQERHSSVFSPEWTMSGLDSVSIIYWFSFTALVNFVTLEVSFMAVFSDGFLCYSDGSSVDPSSDWNAPAEVWGNYEEPTLEPPPAALEQHIPEPAKVDLLIAAAVSLPSLWTKQNGSYLKVVKITAQ
uniref:Metadherin b n=1 Tax=Acanthochromis polyacanthus TaxID=80966 RepID=A0A3Q1EMY4_9TELE